MQAEKTTDQRERGPVASAGQRWQVSTRWLHEWQDFANRLHDAGHQLFCLVRP
jgi:hypothetical protein